MNIRNILAVVAHPDDLELMAGGLVLKTQNEGGKIHVLILTDGMWTTPDGTLLRPKVEIEREMDDVLAFMNYDSCDQLDGKALELEFKDSLVCEVLRRISKYNIDTIITSWNKDTHRDHRIASEIALSASRRVPNFLMGQINYYFHDFFTPNIYVDITNFWERKIESIKLYKSAWENHSKDWYEFMDCTSNYYGKVIGVKRAEGFISKKFTI